MALNVRGWKHLCQGRRHEALEDFSRAIELDEELAEAYNNRSIARRLEGVEGAAEDEDLADALTMHDLEAQMKLRQQRKWMCIGYNARGEPEGEKLATDADFLISFASPDKDENNRILHELKTGVNYDGGLRFLPSCR
jgi:tetratricopeptide (TPR) repeat protein